MIRHMTYNSTRYTIRHATWRMTRAAVYEAMAGIPFLAATLTEDELVWRATLRATQAATW